MPDSSTCSLAYEKIATIERFRVFEFIANLIADSGYLGIFALMALENLFPPLPSELIMPFAGFSVGRGELGAFGVVVAGTAGSVAGAMPWYYAGKLLGQERLHGLAERHGRWLTVSAAELDKALDAFERHGTIALLFGRLVPGIRTLISVPAGVVDIPLGRFLAYSTAGSLVWVCALTGAGYLLEDKYEQVATYLDPVAKTMVGLLVATYLYRLVTFKRAS